MSKIDEKINLAIWAGISCITLSFIPVFSAMLKVPNWGAGFVAKFIIFIQGLTIAFITGISVGFLTWLFFRSAKLKIHKIYYILLCILGAFIGLSVMKLFKDAGVFHY